MMQFTKEVLQNKAPSLEEGPIRCPAHNKNCVFYRTENRSIFGKCIEVIKLILFLEVIFVVGWVGKILISNYHLEYNKDITAHDSFRNNFHGDDFPVTPNSISNNDLVNSMKGVDTISSTGRRQISTTPEMVAAFANTEESYGDNEWPWFKRYLEILDKDVEWPYKIYHGKNVLSNPPLDNADMDILEEIFRSRTIELDPPKVKIPLTDDLEVPPTLFPNSGLIHVIVDRLYNSNDEPNKKTEVPFPLFEVLGDSKTADEEKNELENDTTENSDISDSSNTSESSDIPEIDSVVKSILDYFEKYSNYPEPVITDTTENHDFKVEDILSRPEDLNALSTYLNSNNDLVYKGTISAPKPLGQDEIVPSEAEPHIRGSFDPLPQNTEDKNVVEQDAKFLIKSNPVPVDDLDEIEREIMKIFLDSNENVY